MKIFLLLLFFPLVCFSQQTNHQVSLDTGFVIHLNEESGLVAYDNGMQQNFAYIGTAKVDKCIVGSCRDFNGTTDLVNKVYALNHAQFSFSLWAYSTSTNGAYRCMFSDVDGLGYGAIIMRIVSDTDLQFYVYQTSGGHQAVFGTGLFQNNKWHFIVGTFSLTSNYQRLYLDGKLIGSRTPVSAINPTAGGVIEIGRMWHPGGAHYWDGRLDEVVLHMGKELSQAEVSYLYTNQVGGHQ